MNKLPGLPPLPPKLKREDVPLQEVQKYPLGGKINPPGIIKTPQVEITQTVPQFMVGAVLKINQETVEKSIILPQKVNNVSVNPLAPPPLPGALSTKITVQTDNVRSNNPFIGAPVAGIAKNPFTVNNSIYELKLPQNPSKRFMEIYNSKKTVADMTQEELRVVYFSITGRMGSPIYTATTINHIAKTGKHPDDDVREESDWMFIGSEVHAAAETRGESLKKLFYFDGDTIPEMPEEYKKLSKDHRQIAEAMIVNKLSDIESYIQVKDTVATKKIKPEWISQGYVFESDAEILELQTKIEDLIEERDYSGVSDTVAIEKAITEVEKSISKIKDSDDKKSVQSVAKAAATEYDKIKDSFPVIKKFIEEQAKYEAKKDDVRARAAKVEGAVVIDDIPYIVMRGFRAYESIAKTYGAFHNASDAYHCYHPYEVSGNQFECLSEYVMLDKYKLANGKEVPVRGMVDRLIFDHTSKIVFCIDLKTHGGKEDFLHGNYVKHSYDRAMSFYKFLIENELKRRNLEGWRIVMAILPISMVSLEVGVSGVTLLNISEADLERGKNGGYVKPEGADFFNNDGYVQRTAGEKMLQWMLEIEYISTKTSKYKTRGWEKVINDFEMIKEPKVMQH